MTEIAQNPRDVDALVGAGREAVEVGDVAAAMSFFERANQLAPRDARVKAGMASAMVIAERPRRALDLFAEAASLGADEGEIAADRGLAYDMTGDPARAQADYQRAIRAHDTAATRRRLALSLAISGRRAEALRVIDADLRANDRAAWRAQAFVLALTGDAAGAERTAERVMPVGTAGAMAPFFARLEALTSAQKAMAVHFGEFPSDIAAAPAPSPAGRDNVAIAQAEPPPATVPPRRRVYAPRTRSGTEWVPPLDPSLQPAPTPATRVASAAPRPTTPAPAPAATAPTRFAPNAASDESASGGHAAPGFSIAPSGAAAAPATARHEDFAAVAALVNALPPEVTLSPPSPAAATPSTPPRTATSPAPRAAAPSPAATPRRAPRRPARPANPSRHWVQIAGGANRAALPREFARLQALAPDQLRRRTAYTTPLRATNRLLVGPFESESAAQAFVNQLAARHIAAFAWTSEDGQEIERLQTPR
jgi:tetratricopeptide (TPR) repeat protein